MADAALRFAKMLTTQGLDVGMTRQDFEAEISKRAEATRAHGESREQAFTRVATADDDGRLLFKASVMAPPKQAPQDFQAKPPQRQFSGEAGAELERMARAMAKDKSISYEQAFARLWSDPEGAELVARAKAEAADKRREIAAQRWPITSAAREFSR
jgi:hypothetical protein